MQTVYVTASPYIGAVVAASSIRQPTEFDRLLQKKPATELDRLLQKPRPTEFEKLLQKPMTRKAAPVVKRVAKKVASKMLGGAISVFTTANDIASGILEWNRANFAKTSRSQPPKPPTKSNSSAKIGSSSLSSLAPEIMTVYVTSARPKSSPLLATMFVPGVGGASIPKSSPRSFGEVFKQSQSAFFDGDYPARSQPRSSPKTKTQPSGVRSVPSNDICVRARKPRPSCPARGYKLVCKQWSKKRCQ